MTAMRFRTKDVEIEALQYTGDNYEEVLIWTEMNFRMLLNGEGDTLSLAGVQVYDKLHDTWIWVLPGQWIVRGVKEEYYPCDNETFFWKYEEIDEMEVVD
jgi:hypothetical protein